MTNKDNPFNLVEHNKQLLSEFKRKKNARYQRAWRKKNREQFREYMRDYYRLYRNKHRKAIRTYNREYMRLYSVKNRKKIRDAGKLRSWLKRGTSIGICLIP